MNKKRVLFICSRNSCRSQMAEAFLRNLGRSEFEVFSAGLEADEIDPIAKQVMEEIGYSLEGQFSKSLDRYLNDRFSYLITVCEKAEKACPIFPGVSIRQYWPIDDPVDVQGDYKTKLNAYRQTREEVLKRIKQFLKDEKKTR